MDQSATKPFAILRTTFGLVWLIDACFKWTPGFFKGFSDYLTSAAQGQPMLISSWIHIWVKIISINPNGFALIVAILESLIALSLILGLFTRLGITTGIILSFIIWSAAQGFGGPYMQGSTDIGTGIIYIFVFMALWLGKCWQYYSLDSKFITK